MVSGLGGDYPMSILCLRINKKQEGTLLEAHCILCVPHAYVSYR